MTVDAADGHYGRPQVNPGQRFTAAEPPGRGGFWGAFITSAARANNEPCIGWLYHLFAPALMLHAWRCRRVFDSLTLLSSASVCSPYAPVYLPREWSVALSLLGPLMTMSRAATRRQDTFGAKLRCAAVISRRSDPRQRVLVMFSPHSHLSIYWLPLQQSDILCWRGSSDSYICICLAWRIHCNIIFFCARRIPDGIHCRSDSGARIYKHRLLAKAKPITSPEKLQRQYTGLARLFCSTCDLFRLTTKFGKCVAMTLQLSIWRLRYLFWIRDNDAGCWPVHAPSQCFLIGYYITQMTLSKIACIKLAWHRWQGIYHFSSGLAQFEK